MMPLRHRGLTLIELTMGVAVAAVLLAIAGPSFQQALNSNRLSSVANELTGAVQLARSEAVRANRRVTLCSSDDGSACSDATSTWSALYMRDYLGVDGSDVHWDLIRAACASVADTAIHPMQDILGLGTEHRMNFPGKAEGYWEWRFDWSEVNPGHAARLRQLCHLYGRDGSNDALP